MLWKVWAVQGRGVHAYFEVGRTIVEEEQAGSSRAAYGKQVLARVSERLTEEYGRGFSKKNVKQMRQLGSAAITGND